MDKLKRFYRSYIATLFSSLMLGFVSVHTLEDILLMSIGRFAPLPLFVMYALGLIVSWLVMGVLMQVLKAKGASHHHDH